MTEKIQHIIEDIRLKCNSLHGQLVSERTVRKELEAELDNKKTEIATALSQNEAFKQEVIRLKSELSTIVQQKIDHLNAVEADRNGEIDSLVREIEHCINQLKQ